ncbi:DUF4345 domain-containing protein [Erythrobacter insulae]|uniref:DUF4345 domain-containing protein n=1 Tax=Erythrobacter insulae TaxID=2584124 RepID=A0A547P9X9_9SPHN|nr:DUF4345 domain-containing protein [Erythrobacter insulae]TRD10926.1 DUF4345 domain-containing protein [Erythrobacter insulae]
MARLLHLVLHVFGVTCCGIATVHMLLGLSWVPDAGNFTATLDSQDRFYASIFFGFGTAVIWSARDLKSRRKVLGLLLGLFFLGGLARILSVLAIGWPHPMFIVLGALELTMPPILWFWSRVATRETAIVR